MVNRLLGRANFRLLILLALVAVPLSTACWAGYVGGAYGSAKSRDGTTSLGEGTRPVNWGYGAFRSAGPALAPYDQEQGIRVRATGTASGVPDLAIISLGVESIEDTASEARAKAATAMAGVMEVLKEAEIEDRDIQTRHFNISPRYRSVKVTECGDEGETGVKSLEDPEDCTTFWEQELAGYSVSNQVSVKVRDLSGIGTIIDQVTDAAGDLVRVNGISFTIEDIDPLKEQARTEAMEKMKQNAEDLAELAGVGLGRLVHLQEQTAYIEPPQQLALRAAFAESAADTSISAGELDVSVSVSAVYLITEPETE
jgi:uncharacterized protein YggE